MAADAGVEVDLVVADVADDASVAGRVRRDLLPRRSRRPPRQQRRRRWQCRGRGVPVRAVHRRDERQPVRGHAVHPGRPAADARTGQRHDRQRHVGGGRIAVPAQSPYVASKWALEGISEGLAQELAPFGIRVAIVEPGVTKSAIFAKNIDAPNSTGATTTHYRRMFQFYAAGMASATDPFEVGRVIEHAITTDEPQLRYPVELGRRRDGRAARPHRATPTGSDSACSRTTPTTSIASARSSASTSQPDGGLDVSRLPP